MISKQNAFEQIQTYFLPPFPKDIRANMLDYILYSKVICLSCLF